MGLVPAASYGNRKAITDVQVDQALDPVWTDILFDPQTSGGLLFSVPASEVINWLRPYTNLALTVLVLLVLLKISVA